MNDNNGKSYQNIIVMRHGDRIDNSDPLWVTTAKRPWNPPLIEDGMIRAFSTGRKLRSSLDFPIHRVFVSPFLRCIQTASEVISALSAVDDGPIVASSKDLTSLDQSKLKVSIEYGLCEMLNKEAIRHDVAPKDGKFDFNISELEAMLPSGMVDRSVDRVYKEMPQWEESVQGSRDRYVHIIKALADKYPSENLLLVTHGEGVGCSVSGFMKDASVYEVEYCGYSQLRRQILSKNESGEFEQLTKHLISGISFLHLGTMNNNSPRITQLQA